MKPENATRIFLDMEFTGLHQNTTVISLAMVDEHGRSFYAELPDYDPDQIDDWIRDNVISQLVGEPCEMADDAVFGDYPFVVAKADEWLSRYESVVIVSDHLSYDWMLFCEMFGGAMKLPPHIYYIPLDICSIFYARGIDPDISRELFAGVDGGGKHNALWDAFVIKWCFEKLEAGK